MKTSFSSFFKSLVFILVNGKFIYWFIVHWNNVFLIHIVISIFTLPGSFSILTAFSLFLFLWYKIYLSFYLNFPIVWTLGISYLHLYCHQVWVFITYFEIAKHILLKKEYMIISEHCWERTSLLISEKYFCTITMSLNIFMEIFFIFLTCQLV